MSIKKYMATLIEMIAIFFLLMIMHSVAFAAYKRYGVWYATIIGGLVGIILGFAFLFGMAFLWDFVSSVFKNNKKHAPPSAKDERHQ